MKSIGFIGFVILMSAFTYETIIHNTTWQIYLGVGSIAVLVAVLGYHINDHFEELKK